MLPAWLVRAPVCQVPEESWLWGRGAASALIHSVPALRQKLAVCVRIFKRKLHQHRLQAASGALCCQRPVCWCACACMCVSTCVCARACMCTHMWACVCASVCPPLAQSSECRPGCSPNLSSTAFASDGESQSPAQRGVNAARTGKGDRCAALAERPHRSRGRGCANRRPACHRRAPVRTPTRACPASRLGSWQLRPPAPTPPAAQAPHSRR